MVTAVIVRGMYTVADGGPLQFSSAAAAPSGDMGGRQAEVGAGRGRASRRALWARALGRQKCHVPTISPDEGGVSRAEATAIDRPFATFRINGSKSLSNMNRYSIFFLNTGLLSKGSRAAHLVVVVFLQALYNMLWGTLRWIGRRLDWQRGDAIQAVKKSFIFAFGGSAYDG